MVSNPTGIELHVHLEGSISPSLLVQLADKYGRPGIPARILTADGDSYRPISDFPDFLETFKTLTSLLRTPADYHAAALDAGAMLAASGVHYAEVIIGYGVMQRWGLDPLPIQRALSDATAQIRETGGPRLAWLPDAVRQFGPDNAWRDLEAALKAGADLGVVGFGLGGDESSGDLQPYRDIFATARNEGLGTTVHAGETDGPHSVRDAVEVGGVARIGHAVSAVRDDAVMSLLEASGVFLELCPGSNVATGAIPALADHPLQAFLARGIPCCLNTDDPRIFNLDLPGEYAAARSELGLTDAQQQAMYEQAAAAAFGDVN
jgi:aminodeoxyfutalosine deaminase